MAEKKDNVTSKFKDNVFCMLYRDKRNLLELYNALNNSAYTNVDDLQVTTLNGGSYMKYKNDASFLLCMSLYMFEQQSSKNPNMPLRFLHYVSDVFRELFSNSMLHRRSMIKIPVPHFVTFYNGLEKWVEDEDEIRLSDMYEISADNPELELKDVPRLHQSRAACCRGRTAKNDISSFPFPAKKAVDLSTAFFNSHSYILI